MNWFYAPGFLLHYRWTRMNYWFIHLLVKNSKRSRVFLQYNWPDNILPPNLTYFIKSKQELLFSLPTQKYVFYIFPYHVHFDPIFLRSPSIQVPFQPTTCLSAILESNKSLQTRSLFATFVNTFLREMKVRTIHSVGRSKINPIASVLARNI